MKHPIPAFTIVELLVVVSIVTVLVTLLLPSISQARELAQNTVCAANMRQLGTGINTYATDNNTKYPWGTLRPGVGPYTTEFPTSTWDVLVDTYIGGKGIDSADSSTYANGNVNKLQVLICPKDPYKGDALNSPRSYAMNSTISGGANLYAGTTSSANASTYIPPASLKFEGVLVPAETFLLVESPANAAGGRGRQGGTISGANGPYTQSSGIPGAGINISGTVFIAVGAKGVTTHPNDLFNYLHADLHEARIYPLLTDTRPGIAGSTVPGTRFNASFAANAWDWPGASLTVAPRPWALQ